MREIAEINHQRERALKRVEQEFFMCPSFTVAELLLKEQRINSEFDRQIKLVKRRNDIMLMMKQAKAC